MKTISLYIRPVWMLALLLPVCFSLQAQVKEGLQPADSLYRKIQLLDSCVFNAFNKRDTATFNDYFSKDLEFFHDQGGLTGYKHTIDFLKEQIKNKSDLKRTLAKEGFEVYPIPGYGAMEFGVHIFTHTENGKPVVGTFKFLHVWKNDNGHWTITRVISYGH
jgi:Domain of unknown function (DUF4440)